MDCNFQEQLSGTGSKLDPFSATLWIRICTGYSEYRYTYLNFMLINDSLTCFDFWVFFVTKQFCSPLYRPKTAFYQYVCCLYWWNYPFGLSELAFVLFAPLFPRFITIYFPNLINKFIPWFTVPTTILDNRSTCFQWETYYQLEEKHDL